MSGQGDEKSSQVSGEQDPVSPVSPIGRDDGGVREIERRLGDIVGTIQEYASLRFDARTPIGPDGDIVDAVAAGVNFLGEELEASFNEIENRVAVRTGELAMATEELSHRALHDQLTGLANRTLLWDRVTHRLGSADRRTVGFAVLFLDLDKFKAVNDIWGHAAGDKLLVEVAGRISAEVRVGDTAARMGGDEFVVLLDEVVSAEEAMATACRLCMVLRAPYEIGSHQETVMASMGVAFGPARFETADAVIAAADAAMYDAKRRGPGQCVEYDEDVHGQFGPPVSGVGEVVAPARERT
ncbi:GGDEF domain-containing protein [Demequina lutea]|uniref:Diguanylate cyclase (GGDEF)-like protein n=1 Tax=Demequina lutea TaxID=431489 RepID=A0A7Y9Z9W4_9MICO|nr:GGDEF domain-containing protein [Demequina lutea]NYI41464.1 diguanylate cyclase (GGDEF)-like protein [Demequina lutea]